MAEVAPVNFVHIAVYMMAYIALVRFACHLLITSLSLKGVIFEFMDFHSTESLKLILIKASD